MAAAEAEASSSSTNNDETQVYKDLLGFLNENRDDLKIAAMDAVLGVTDAAGKTKLLQHGIVAPLAKCTSHPDPVGTKALEALVFLSSSSEGPTEAQCVEDLLDAGALGRFTEICLSSSPQEAKELQAWKKRINLSMALLANMTRTERGAVELVGRSMPDKAVKKVAEGETTTLPTKPSLELLLRRFLVESYVEEAPPKEDEDDEDDAAARDARYHDPYQHFSAVLMNSTQTEAGRQFLLKLQHRPDGSSTCLLSTIFPHLRAKNLIRRRGIAGTVKNTCLERDSAWYLLNQLGLQKHVLYPLAGPEELDVDEKRGLDPDLWLEGPDKVREPDKWTRLYLVESILLLCASGRQSRETLRLARTYVVLKWADMVEEEEDVSERINECVQYLRRDEEGTYDGHSDDFVNAQVGNKAAAKALPMSTSAATVGKDTNYDDVD